MRTLLQTPYSISFDTSRIVHLSVLIMESIRYSIILL